MGGIGLGVGGGRVEESVAAVRRGIEVGSGLRTDLGGG
jgi:hypothetical protein